MQNNVKKHMQIQKDQEICTKYAQSMVSIHTGLGFRL